MASPQYDPTVLAYMRALGFEESDAERKVAGQREQAEQRYAMDKPRVLTQGIEDREDIAEGYESRGLLRSGAFAKDDAGQRADEQNRLAGMQIDLTEGVAGLESDLAARIAAGRREMAERLLAVGGKQYLEERSLPYTGG